MNLGYRDELLLRQQVEGKPVIDTQASSFVANGLPLRLTHETRMSEELSYLEAVVKKLQVFPPEEEQEDKEAPFPSFSFLIFGPFESGLDEDDF